MVSRHIAGHETEVSEHVITVSKVRMPQGLRLPFSLLMDHTFGAAVSTTKGRFETGNGRVRLSRQEMLELLKAVSNQQTLLPRFLRGVMGLPQGRIEFDEYWFY